MVRNIVIFSSPSKLDSVKSLDLRLVRPLFNGSATQCGLPDDRRLFLLQDGNGAHVDALLADNLEGELRFVYHSRTFPVPDSGNPPRVDHVARRGFVSKVQARFADVVVRHGQLGMHLRNVPLAFPYEKVIAILTNTEGNGNQEHFDAIWDWLQPQDPRKELFQQALFLHNVAIDQAGGLHPHEVTGRAEIEALEGWNTLLPEERPPMDGGDERFREYILGVINQTG